jgi:hypothetical protein
MLTTMLIAANMCLQGGEQVDISRPALENLATRSPRVIAFVLAMTAGMALHDFWQKL